MLYTENTWDRESSSATIPTKVNNCIISITPITNTHIKTMKVPINESNSPNPISPIEVNPVDITKVLYLPYLSEKYPPKGPTNTSAKLFKPSAKPVTVATPKVTIRKSNSSPYLYLKKCPKVAPIRPENTNPASILATLIISTLRSFKTSIKPDTFLPLLICLSLL